MLVNAAGKLAQAKNLMGVPGPRTRSSHTNPRKSSTRAASQARQLRHFRQSRHMARRHSARHGGPNRCVRPVMAGATTAHRPAGKALLRYPCMAVAT